MLGKTGPQDWEWGKGKISEAQSPVNENGLGEET